jgi:hypothetical protein
MNRVDLIVLACSIVNPGTCQTHHLLFQSNGSLRACIEHAQPYLAQWIGEHPNLRVARYRCAWPDSESEKS